MNFEKLRYCRILVLAAMVMLAGNISCGKSRDEKIVLRSLLAGRWYTDDAEALKGQIDAFFKKAQVEPLNNVIALILPHAGYFYSGQTAVYGLKAADKKYKRIVIIGPSHRVGMKNALSVPKVTHYETVLGQIPLDVAFIEKLRECPLFQDVPQAHKHEHSVQIELPLLQYNRRDFKLVPIIAGDCSAETIEKAADVLKSLVDDETLVIASSDFVHYGPNYGYVPFKENIPEQIKKLDMGAYEYIAKLDSSGFLKYKQKTAATICGSVPVAILLSMLAEPVEAKLMAYETSGNLMSDFTNSVSYLSAAFCGRWPVVEKTKPKKPDTRLSEADKKQLLKLARGSLIYYLQKRRLPNASELGVTVSSAMSRHRAAFVTLKKNSQLRGCIGDIFPQQPLYKSVIGNAVNAGVNDWRFAPVTKAECSGITIEISALTPPEVIASPAQIRIGVDGVILSKDGRRAVYLPQVAPEQGWDVETMLEHLSLKAGLSADGWKTGAVFEVFQAEVFGESDE